MLPAWLNRIAPAPAGDPTTLAQGPTALANPGRAVFRAAQRTRSPCAGWPSRCPPFSGRRRPPRGQRAGDHEDNPAPDLHGVIGKALLEAAQQRDVDGGWDTVLPMRIQQHAQQLLVQVVHRVVFFTQTRGARIVRYPVRPIAHSDRHFAHLGEARADFRGK
jgi:hypothetical protein